MRTFTVAKIDEMTGRACGEIVAFWDAKAVKNPVMECVGMGFVLFVILAPLLFGLLCISIVCREITE